MLRTSILLLLSILTLTTLRAEPLAIGAPAPDLTAVDQNGAPFNFTDIYAKGITLVYFYPKAGSSGCTAEACSLRDAYEKLQAERLQIIGVSRDTSAAQKEFETKNRLPFTLVADTDGKVAAAFGVPPVKPGVSLSARQSFIVKDGKIAWTSLHAKTNGSADEVQKALDELK